jgi:ABC-type sugar transport system ATPase subunit
VRFRFSYGGREVLLGMRPEDFGGADDARNGATGVIDVTVARAESLGSKLIVYFSPNGAPPREAGAAPTGVAGPQAVERLLTARLDRRVSLREGAPPRIAVDVERLYFFDPESGDAIV